MTAFGPSRHFAHAKSPGRFRREADIKWQAGPAGKVANDPTRTFGASFNYLIGDGKHRWRHLDAELSRRLQIDEELELGRLQHR